MKRMTPAVAALLIVNIVVFIAGALMPNQGEHLINAAALWYPANGHFGLWQMASYMFLHGSPGHIFFNMFALVSFGKILEQQWGTRRFVLFYFVCGMSAALVQTGVNWYEFRGFHEHLVAAEMTPSDISSLLANGGGQVPTDPALKTALYKLYGIYASPMIGASGAVYGLLVAFGFLHPNSRLALMFIPVPVPAKYVIPGLLLLDLFSGVTGFSIFGANVAHYAHIGGAVTGFLLMLLWRKRSRRPTWEVQAFR